MRLLTAGLILQTLSAAAFAEAGGPDLNEARRLLVSGHADQAAALLEVDLMRFGGNPDYDYLLGLSLYASGRRGPALFAFERVMMSDPKNVDARLKAARISAERGEKSYANSLLAQLADQPLDQNAQKELGDIRVRLSLPAPLEQVAVRGYVLGGIGWDDNVTSGPGQSSLFIPALSPPPPVPPKQTAMGTASRAKDMVGVGEAGVSLRKAIAENTWLVGDGVVHQGLDRSRNDVKDSYVNLNLGLLQRSGNEFFGGTLLLQDYLVSNKTYRYSMGARLNWMHPLNDRSSLTGYVQGVNFIYPNNVIDNATRTLAGLAHEFTTPGFKLQTGAYGGREVAKDPTKPHFSFHIAGVSLGANIVYDDELSFQVGWQIESQRHDALDALYRVMRTDTMHSVGVGADYRINSRWHMLPRYGYTHNASNTALYDYARNTFMLQLKGEFDNETN